MQTARAVSTRTRPRGRRTALLLALVLTAPGFANLGLARPALAGGGGGLAYTYSYSGASQQHGVWNATVPPGMCTVTFDVRGGGGGLGGDTSTDYPGGRGGHVVATFAVTPGQPFKVGVGQQGGSYFHSYGILGSPGGAAGDGPGATPGAGDGFGINSGIHLAAGGGGAASMVWVTDVNATTPDISAGGGGGAGSSPGSEGGDADAVGHSVWNVNIGTGPFDAHAVGGSSQQGTDGVAQHAGPPVPGGQDQAGGGGGGGTPGRQDSGQGGTPDFDPSFTTLYAVGGAGASNYLAPGVATAVNGTAPSVADGLVTASFTACPVSISVPGAPSGLTVTPGNASAALSFLVPGTGGSAITGYDYSLDGGSWSPLPAPTLAGGTVSATLPGLTNGTTYAVRVRALNAVGSGAASAPVGVTPVAPVSVPAAPLSLTTVPGDTTATVSFPQPADGGSPITGYEVSLDAGATWTALATSTTGPSVTGALSNLVNGTTYPMQVRATNALGAGPASPSSAVTPVAPPAPPVPTPSGVGVPGTPSALVVHSGNAAATLEFGEPADGGSPITGYEVSTDGGTTWGTLATTGAAIRSATIGTLVNGTSYGVRVRARNIVGAGPSTPTAVITPYVPGAPSSPVATGGVASLVASWTPPTNTANVAGYTVVATPGPATCSTQSAQDTSCVLGAASGTSYTLTVLTVGANGVSSAASAPSNPAAALAPPVPAVAPVSAPTTLTTDRGQIALATPSQQVTVIGTGFAPDSEATVIIYSTPQPLATVRTNAVGGFSVAVTVPAGLAPGAHNFVASGVDPTGALRAMRLPVTVPPTSVGTTGTGSGSQTASVPVPAGGSVVLLTAAGTPTTSVVVDGQGTYVLDSSSGVITFVPVAGFVGTAMPVTYRLTDSTGSVATGTYTAVVTGPAATPGPTGTNLPPADPEAPSRVRRRLSARLALAPWAVTRGPGAGSVVPVTVRLSARSLTSAQVTVSATVSGRQVTIASGALVAGGPAQSSLTVQARLTPLGRGLAAVPGGRTVLVRARVRARGTATEVLTTGRTTLVSGTVVVARSVYFASGSSTVSDADRGYLAHLARTLAGVRVVTLIGHTDDRGSRASGQRLGARRAREVALLLGAPGQRVLRTDSRGEWAPRASNEDETGRATNRRVDIVLTYSSP